MTPGAEPTAAVTSRDRWCRRIAAALSLVGGGLLLASAALPWVSGQHGPNAFHYGPGYFGWVILGAGAALVLTSAVAFFTIPLLRPNVCMPFIPSAIVAMVLADQWSGQLQAHPGSAYPVCLAGIGFGVLATIALIPAEHRVARPPRLPRNVPSPGVDSPSVSPS